MSDAYEFAIPWRDGVPWRRYGEGQQRTDRIFDGTAPTSTFRFAGRMQRDVMPPFGDIFTLEAGPLVRNRDEKRNLNIALRDVSDQTHALLQSGNFHIATHEALMELFAGTCAIYMRRVGPPHYIETEAAPMGDVAIEPGAAGKVHGIHYKRKMRPDEIMETWPRGTFEPELREKMSGETGNQKIPINQYTRFNRVSQRWELFVYWVSGSTFIWRETSRTSPWIVPRFFMIPGEPYGRGPVQLALPFIRTANKARELTLQAAAFSVFGVFTHADDGVFNPDTANFEPASFWAVASPSGRWGRAVERVPIPADFDISSIVLDDERQQIREALLDQRLPPDAGPVRSPTEIVERMKRLAEDMGGVYGRLAFEGVQPTAQRAIEIQEAEGILPTNLTIDQLLVRMRVTTPAAAAQQVQEIEGLVDWMTIIGEFMGPQGIAMMADVEAALPHIGRLRGVREQFIRSPAQIKRLQEQLAAGIAAAQQAEAAAGRGPAPESTNGTGLPAQ